MGRLGPCLRKPEPSHKPAEIRSMCINALTFMSTNRSCTCSVVRMITALISYLAAETVEPITRRTWTALVRSTRTQHTHHVPPQIEFIGPTAEAMYMLGDKIASTIVAQSADVPTIKWNGTGVTLGDRCLPGQVCALLVLASIAMGLNLQGPSCLYFPHGLVLKAHFCSRDRNRRPDYTQSWLCGDH